MRRFTTCGLVALALLAGACSRGPDPDELFASGAAPGYSGGGLGAGGFGAPGVGGSVLPGTSIGDTVLFTVDQSTLTPDAIATLNAQIGWLQANPGAVQIEGHADERGTREYNLALGLRRASAVRDYMVAQGVPDGRISVNTYGRERPVATCPSESCWAQNRRAVTVVTGGAGV